MRLNLVEHRAQPVGGHCRGDRARRGSAKRDQRHLAHHHSHHASACRPDRHAQGDLLALRPDAVRDRAIQADDRQQQPGAGQRREHHRSEPFGGEHLGDLLVERDQGMTPRRQGRSHARAGGRRGAQQSWSAGLFDHEVGWRGAVLLGVWQVPGRTIDPEVGAVLFDIANHADDRQPRVVSVGRADAADAPADRILAGPCLPCELLGDEDDPWRIGRVTVGQQPAAEEAHADRAEIVGVTARWAVMALRSDETGRPSTV